MLAFLIRRILLMVPTTLGVALTIFLIFQAAPGDPATVMMGMGGGGAMGSSSDASARKEAFKREFGLDRNWAVQFLNYIGPFNLMRDGHAWFSSPYSERKLEQRTLPGGDSIQVGKPLSIAPLKGTSPQDLARWQAAVLAIARDSDGDGSALESLQSAGRAALPVWMTALFERYSKRGARSEQEVPRLIRGLEAVVGAQLEVPQGYTTDPVHLAAIEAAFAWYYTAGGGRWVKNSGAKPWGGLLTFDLGKEMQTKQPVAEELLKRLKVTVPLSLVSVLLSYLLALPLGIFSARRQGSLADGVVTVGLFVLYSIPTFWAGLMLILAFGKTGLDWLPVVGLHDKDSATYTAWQNVKDVGLHAILPIVTLTYGSLAYLSRQMRGGMLDVIRMDYIRTARAKGLSEGVVIYKHALRNSVIPVITLLASILPILIGGSIIVESVFDLPGMGKYAYEGLLRRDFNVIMATTLFVGVMTQVGILLSDLTYSLVDPRIRHS